VQLVTLYISTALLLKDISESVKRLVCARDHPRFGNTFPCAGFAVVAGASVERTEQTSHDSHYSSKVHQSTS